MADWLELETLAAGDGNYSAEDATDALLRGASGLQPDPLDPSMCVEPDELLSAEEMAIYPGADYGDLEELEADGGGYSRDEEEAAGALVRNAFMELRQRERDAGPAYPFWVEEPRLCASPHWHRLGVPYVFCLCLANETILRLDPQDYRPRRLFEDLAQEAARRYVGGRAVRLAFPRRPSELPRSFKCAVERLCTLMGEGGGLKPELHDARISAGDAHVDVVAWRDFPDLREGKLVLFGNCTSSRHWRTRKLREMSVRQFRGDWVQDDPPSVILRSLFIPYRVVCEPRQWRSDTRAAGIIFERCRLAFWAGTEADFAAQRSWVQDVLGAIRQTP
ncbi:MAG: hypothetical protein FJX75_08865 [Armatimonadetes bacterium]|nr:hypothetical protein [Armatimonadota bacterium]